jgi:TetR/AcrR family transcriptional regulator, transcriptional repressor for nem operon
MTKAEKTRQFIIEKAAPIFNKKGVAGTSISDIMEATQLAKGGVYGNFENKEEICLEVFKYLTKELSSSIDLYVRAQETAKGKLFAMLDFYNENSLRSDREGCPLLNFGVEVDDTNPALKQKVKEGIKATQSKINKLVEMGVANGEFMNSFNAAQFAIKMFSMIEGAVFVGRVLGNNSQMKVIIELLKNEIEQNCK